MKQDGRTCEDSKFLNFPFDTVRIALKTEADVALPILQKYLKFRNVNSLIRVGRKLDILLVVVVVLACQ